jgi:competence protein ComGC
MKKKSFGLVLLISLLIIVIGFYVFVNSVLNKNDGVEDGGSSDIVYIDKQEDDVEKVTYNDGSSSFTIKKSANVYLLTEDEDFPVNETAASFVFNSVARIVFERRFKVDNSALAEYGLVDAHRVLNVTYVNGARLTLTIGAYNEYAGAYYCSVGDGFVYLIDSEFADAFEYTYADLLQDDTVEAPQNGFASLKSIEIKGPSGTVVLAPTENGEDWTDVKSLGPCKQRVMRTDLDGKLPVAKYVRIVREGGPEFFHLNGIYIYGNQAA